MTMKKTNRELISIRLEEHDFRAICGRYHYGDTDLVLLKEVYDKYLKKKAVSAWYQIGYDKAENAAVLMTLGAETDEIQNRLSDEGRLAEAYMLECLAMAVLERAYGQMDELLHAQTGLWCTGYRFSGGDDMTEVVTMVKDMEQEEVYCNESCVLIPKKSVVYVAVLQANPANQNCAQKVCAGCGRKDCPNRAELETGHKLNYGYQRIFGVKKNKE